VRRLFRLEAKRCEKGSEKYFASKRNKGLVSLRSATAILHAKRNGHKAKNSETKQIKANNSVLDRRISNFHCSGWAPGSYSSLKG
jgi:hypothetical protein